ncbi:MAG: GNAT family N-acetyltransferase [Bdellovibrionales bacterium]|nr:GNAT family N-acetyltransferase [Bdellovibrionales bacterium]
MSELGNPFGIFVYKNADHERVGYGVCRPYEWDPSIKGIEIGYIIDPQHWGKGVASHIAKDLMKKVTPQPSTAVYALIHDENIGSQKVIQKVGFTHFHKTTNQQNTSIWRFGY